MKTTTVFSVEQVAPCPSCGTPRVGIDRDDDYDVVPGVVQEIIPTTCTFRRRHRVSGLYTGEAAPPADTTAHGYGYRDAEWAARRAAYEQAKASCPECGGPCAVIEPEHGRDSDHYVVACERSRMRTPKRSYSPLPGCPKCRGSHSWHGVGLTADD